MKLAPVRTELVRPVVGVAIVQRGIAGEHAVAVPLPTGDYSVTSRLLSKGWSRTERCKRIRRKWLGNPYTDQIRVPCTDQTSRGEYHITRLAVEHPGEKGRHK